jgi:poly-beta-1,6-N-acetyl-D-glucosamine synthase
VATAATARVLFWCCVVLFVYTYLGYPAWLWIVSRLRHIPLQVHPHSPSVTALVAVRNEQEALPSRIANLQRLRYASDRLQVVIASDGSTDSTAQILSEHSAFCTPVILPHAQGKAAALNEAVRYAHGDILVFFDVRQNIDNEAIMELVRPFSDCSVGAVSGSLLIEELRGAGHAGLSRYWNLERRIRTLESASGSMVGATGAIYAIRRELYCPMPTGTILDDVFLPMHVALLGKRVVLWPQAIARDTFSAEQGREFSRKVRTLSGNYQLLTIAPWLITPKNPLLFRFVSHKLLRLLSPFLLLLMLLTAGMSEGRFYKLVYGLQLLFYLGIALSVIVPSAKRLRLLAVPQTFVVLNIAALVAFARFVTGRHSGWR